MELSQIRYVLALCDTLSFTQAARRCGISQPSLTNAVRALEAELGGALFVRRPAVRLTPLGETVRPRFLRIVQEVAAVQMDAGWARSLVADRRPGRSNLRDQPAVAP